MNRPSLSPTEPDADAFTWQVHPAVERPRVTIAAGAVICGLAVGVALTAGSVLVGLVAALVLCLVLHPYFMGVRYVSDATGLTAHSFSGARGLAWTDVRRVDVGSRAAWISPRRRRGWREGRTGVHVLYGEQRAAVLAELRRRLPAEVLPPEVMAADAGRPSG